MDGSSAHTATRLIVARARISIRDTHAREEDESGRDARSIAGSIASSSSSSSSW
jgi:hypothetical protein